MSNIMSCLSFKNLTLLNSTQLYIYLVALSVLYRKYITSPLRAQQVNDVYRFVTMVY
jgi:hypothetical protein